jgi:hypothetical protein
MTLTLPGEGETLHLKENPGAVKSFRFTAGIGGDVPLSAVAVVPAVNVPAGFVVHDVKSRVITAFTTAVTLDIGDGVTSDGFLTTTIIAPQTAVTTGIYKGMVDEGSTTFAGGICYLDGDAIDIEVAVAVVAAGLMEVVILYSEVSADS